MQVPFANRGRLGRLVLGVWAPMIAIICAYQLGSHLLTLPVPEVNDPDVQRALAQTRHLDETGEWMLVHVLYTDCNCSVRVARYLVEEPRPEGLVEKLVLVGEDPELAAKAQAAGFELYQTDEAGLGTQWHMEAAPVLAVVDPANQVQYLGGYTDRKQGAAIRDLEILGDLQSTRPVAALPLFGCAVSQTLQRAVDPLGLR
ncbi:MAG: hypothetical protein VX899_08345 [Myxococcota bacterium]|nr:hypothetical protein [Myxococcota bacterium]